MNTAAEDKIKILNRSMRCFVFGMLGLIPVLGLPFALAALWLSGRVRVMERQMWNAAQPYRVWGVVCAAFGTILWTAVATIVIARLWMMAQGLG